MVSMGCPIVPSPNSQFGSLYLISLKYNYQCKSGLDPIDCKFIFFQEKLVVIGGETCQNPGDYNDVV